ncbi:unnamed protein product [Auanema sp. JU1783]|nr:unnamed protein product [Auanema sp. JU1783]
MRILSLLIALLAVGFSIQQSSAVEDQSITDLFQEVLNVEASLREELKTKWSEKQQQHEQQKQQAIQALNSTLEAFETKLKEEGTKIKSVIDEFRAAKEAEDAQKKEQFTELADEIKQVIDAVKTKKQNEKAEKEQEIKELAEQLKAFFTKRKEEKRKEDEQKIEKLENVFAALNELKVLIVNEMQARADRKAAKQADHEAKKTQYENDLKVSSIFKTYVKQELQSIFDSMKTEEQKLAEQYDTYKTKKDSFKETVKDAIKEDWDFNVSEFVNDKLQKVLDEEAVKIVLKDKVEEKLFPQAAEQSVVNVAGRATILDEITGTSQWQTVTWILLVLAIILAVALVAMIFYNISQRNNYQRLDGHDVESHPSTERTPIVSNVVTPVGYNDEKKKSLVGLSTPIPSTSVTPPGPSAPTGEQQF